MATALARRRSSKASPAAILDNAAIAELLAREGENAEGHLRRAFNHAARAAYGWPIECADLLAQGRSLTELNGIGPYLSRRIKDWLGSEMEAPEPPPIRADFLTATQAQTLLAGKPAWRILAHGDLQMHSTWSDGSDSIAALAEAGIARGYEYIAVTDHSKDLKIASGIDEADLAKQAKEIQRVNQKLARSKVNFLVLQAMEMNISPDGSGDMEPEALAKLDLVLGSFHSQLRGTHDQTNRYLAALHNPDIQILGHPRGRIYNHRTGLIADWPKVFKAAKALDKAVEIDGYPDRQDLNIELLQLARKVGVRISMGSDAHNASQLHFLDYSLAAALAAGIPGKRIINFLPVEDLLEWVKKVRSMSS